jgi:hypothetical protein
MQIEEAYIHSKDEEDEDYHLDSDFMPTTEELKDKIFNDSKRTELLLFWAKNFKEYNSQYSSIKICKDDKYKIIDKLKNELIQSYNNQINELCNLKSANLLFNSLRDDDDNDNDVCFISKSFRERYTMMIAKLIYEVTYTNGKREVKCNSYSRICRHSLAFCWTICGSDLHYCKAKAQRKDHEFYILSAQIKSLLLSI